MKIFRIKLNRSFSSGQSMVEFGLLIGFLIALIIGGIDIGIAIHDMLAIQDAVSRGAQVAAMGGGDDEVRDEIYNYLKDTYIDNVLVEGSFSDSGIVITPAESARDEDSSVTVYLDYELGFVMGPLFDQITVWHWPVSHTTTVELGVPSLPWDEDFENGLTDWTTSSGGGSMGVSATNVHAGTKCVYFRGNSKANNSKMYASVRNGKSSKVTVKWWWKSNGNVDSSGGQTDYFYAEYSVDGGANWTVAFTQNGGPGAVNSTYTQSSFNITTLTGKTFLLRFRASLTDNSEYYYVDDVSVEKKL